MSYLTELEKVKSEEELDRLIQHYITLKYKGQVTDDIGTVTGMFAFGVDEVKRAASEGFDAEVELRIDF